MDNSAYGFTRAAFAWAPDLQCCAESAAFQGARQELHDCLASGRGIAVMTAAPGTGKTLLCLRLAEDLAERFRVVWLPTGGFDSAAAFLQATLFALGRPYRHRGEQELRLQLAAALDAFAERKNVVVLIDEAHTLADSVFDEIRLATTLVQDGQPLLRVLLSGQFPLEERLATAELEAINQRIGAHVTLEPLTRADSAEYVACRLDCVGAEMGSVFAPQAVETIVVAADGNPRCLNQLCDRSLALAVRSGVFPVDDAVVRAALEELKRLPLHWSDPPPPPTHATRPAKTETQIDSSSSVVEQDAPPASQGTERADSVVEFDSSPVLTPAEEQSIDVDTPHSGVWEVGSDVAVEAADEASLAAVPSPETQQPELSTTPTDPDCVEPQPAQSEPVEGAGWEPIEQQALPSRSVPQAIPDLQSGEPSAAVTTGHAGTAPDRDATLEENVDDRQAVLLDERRRMLDSSSPPTPVVRPERKRKPQPQPGAALDGRLAIVRGDETTEEGSLPPAAAPKVATATETPPPHGVETRNAPRRDAREALEQHLSRLGFDPILPDHGSEPDTPRESAEGPARAASTPYVDFVQRLRRLQDQP